MRIFALIFFAATFFCAETNAQSDSLATASKTTWISGAYVQIAMEHSKVNDLTSFNPVLAAAIIVKRNFDLGFFATWYDGNGFVRPLIFPNFFDMSYRYGGGFIGYHRLFDNRFLVGLRMRVGHGEVLWERLDSGENLTSDKMLVLEPQATVGYVFKYVGIEGYVGYRNVSDLEIPELVNADFNGLQYGISIKLGFLNKGG